MTLLRYLCLLLCLCGTPAAAQTSDLLPLDPDRRMVPVALDPDTAALLSASGEGTRVAVYARAADGSLTPLVGDALLLGLDGGDVAFLEVDPPDALALARVLGRDRLTVQVAALPDAEALAERRAAEETATAADLEDGQRAFVILSEIASGVAGFLRPGDRVDIYWTGEVPTSGEPGLLTKLIETRLRIVEIGTPPEPAAAATFRLPLVVSVTPAQAARLAQAQSTGRLTVALVGTDDTAVGGVFEIDQSDLLGIEENAEAGAGESGSCSVRTRRGSEVVSIPVPCVGRGDDPVAAGEWPGPRDQ